MIRLSLGVIVCCVPLTYCYGNSRLDRCWMDSNLEFFGNLRDHIVISRCTHCSLICNHHRFLSNGFNSIVALVSWRG